MNQYAIMPLSDYVGACDSIRAKTGTTKPIKSTELIQQIDNVFEAGKAQSEDVTKNPMYYMDIKSFQWNKKAFPEGFNFVLNLRDKPSELNAALMKTTGIKTVTLICEAEGTVNMAQLLRESTAEVLDITNFKPTPTSMNHLAYNNSSLVSILGEIDMSSCTTATALFSNATALKDIRFKEGTIKISISFANCSLLTAKSLNSIMNGLSSEVTGQTLTLPKYDTVKATYDAVYGEGAWDAIVATKSNWTIAYL